MAKQPPHPQFESYEVYDEHGMSVGRVVLPRRRQFTGSTKGTVYLRRQPSPRPRTPRAA
ncbi:MAG: hypothetical protein AB7L66_03715 [Gemmatimonadales bacterium]